ncbi:MAG: MT-A70 family methyltransferase [Ewingella americana]|uniref:MT-A70 family methyltransferase n=1 Tax=Ewingella americana TaxID=41202 RepID=UPI00242BEF41|nr:MT-A70 family methyltransferase [Ewingella americana]MCI1676594.1 MT-A70 family methyltransferase [Ewingella americana]MCI1853816.1 MT-A70 family methyltransferase [Ewingella americana]MCI1859943.1 MT-A70 family methyltransferase [Ewingella americana]MCI2142271.1 MT-A70 family methyltransferase [Ewingella americana]MCI2163234.1 MT-A70 family methyltransferase [Ewingella americana]
MMYQLIYADPPWRYDNVISNGAAGNHYSTMTLNDLMRLPVWSIAAENSVLAMWYTGTHNAEAVKLAKAWGFQVRTMKGFTWVKLNQLAEQHINKALAAGQVEDFYDLLELLNTQTRMNGGNYTRANSEDLLIAVRGTGLKRASASVKQAFYSPLSEHSEKPAEVRFRLEQLYGDVARIELFSRGDAPGWHHWGNECPFPDVELIPATSRPLSNSRISLVKAQTGHYQAVTISSETKEV